MDDLSKQSEFQIKHDEAVDWVWEYAAANYNVGVLPSGTSISPLVAIVEGMVPYLVDILYDEVNNSNTEYITETVKFFVIPLLGTFSAITKDAAIMLNLHQPSQFIAYAAKLSTGLVVSVITIAMGCIIIDIVEDLLYGKTTVENLQSKDAEIMEKIKKQAKLYYEDVRTKIKMDKRFSPEMFHSRNR